MDEESLAPLIKFIGQKFDEADRRLDQMATKEEVRAQQTETRRHFEVVAEALRGQIQQVAEGVVGVEQRIDGVDQRLERVDQRLDRIDQRLDRFEQKVEAEFIETRAAIRFSYSQLERRIQELEGNYASLKERVERVEARQG
jgi:chromosome segregation ATPase